MEDFFEELAELRACASAARAEREEKTRQRRRKRDKARRLADPETVRARDREQQNRIYANNPVKFRKRAAKIRATPNYYLKQLKWRLKADYGMSLDQYASLLAAQPTCAGCGCIFNGANVKTRPHVDHNHHTGQIRGLLCIDCNLALGRVADNTTTLSNLINYLDENNCHG